MLCRPHCADIILLSSSRLGDWSFCRLGDWSFCRLGVWCSGCLVVLMLWVMVDGCQVFFYSTCHRQAFDFSFANLAQSTNVKYHRAIPSYFF